MIRKNTPVSVKPLALMAINQGHAHAIAHHDDLVSQLTTLPEAATVAITFDKSVSANIELLMSSVSTLEQLSSAQQLSLTMSWPNNANGQVCQFLFSSLSQIKGLRGLTIDFQKGKPVAWKHFLHGLTLLANKNRLQQLALQQLNEWVKTLHDRALLAKQLILTPCHRNTSLVAISCRTATQRVIDISALTKRNRFIQQLEATKHWIKNDDYCHRLLDYVWQVDEWFWVMPYVLQVCQSRPVIYVGYLSPAGRGNTMNGKALLHYVVRQLLTMQHSRPEWVRKIGPFIHYLCHYIGVSRDNVFYDGRLSSLHQDLMSYIARRESPTTSLSINFHSRHHESCSIAEELLIYLQSPAECALEQHLFAKKPQLMAYALGQLACTQGDILASVLAQLKKLITLKQPIPYDPLSDYYRQKLRHCYLDLQRAQQLGQKGQQFIASYRYYLSQSEEASLVSNLRTTLNKLCASLKRDEKKPRAKSMTDKMPMVAEPCQRIVSAEYQKKERRSKNVLSDDVLALSQTVVIAPPTATCSMM